MTLQSNDHCDYTDNFVFNNRSYKSFNFLWNGPWWKAEYKITLRLSRLLAKRKPIFLGKWGLPKNNFCCQKVSHHLNIFIWFSSFWKYVTPYKGKWKQLPKTVNPHFTQKIKHFSKSSKKCKLELRCQRRCYCCQYQLFGIGTFETTSQASLE